MDGRGGCCIARYAAGSAYDSKIDRIMLRFRPIAPKPVLKGTDSAKSTAEICDAHVKTGRGKRRYARNNNNKADSNGSGTKRCNRKRKSPPSSSSSEENDKTVVSAGSFSRGDTVVTLPLLPETPDNKNSSATNGSPISSDACGDQKGDKALPMWLSIGKEEPVQPQKDGLLQGQLRTIGGPENMVVMAPQLVSLVGTWVRVECITDTCVDLYGLGRTDEEKLINLEKDNCPGFLSDGMNRVQWTNKAYREMTTEGGSSSEVVVWLAMKEGTKLPMRSNAFTCSVRLVTSGKEKNSISTLPCDVWRMNCGGFAWRLDIKAALSLGR